MPVDLLHRIGRAELTRPLGTAEPGQAKRWAACCTLLADEFFDLIRQDARLTHVQTAELVRAFLRAGLDQAEAVYVSGHHTARPKEPPFVSAPLQIPDAATRTDKPEPDAEALSAVITKYMRERSPSRRSRKTGLDYEVTFRLVLEIIGDKSVHAITRDDIRAFRDALRTLPPNFSRLNRKAGEDASSEETPEKRLSPKSINKYLLKLSAFFNWAKREDLVEKNSAEGLTVPNSRRPDEQRRAFTRDQLRSLFGRPAEGPASHVWIPLLGLYTGLRLVEIVQFGPADVIE